MKKKIISKKHKNLPKKPLGIKLKNQSRKGEFPPYNYEELLKNWDLKLISYKNIRAVLKVETDKGTFACKYFKYDPNLLDFIIQSIQHLKGNGLKNIMNIIPTKDGKDYFIDGDGNIFFMMPWIKGRESNLKDTKELYLASQLMAKFHLASKGFRPQNLSKIPNSWGKWPTKYKSSLDSLIEVKNLLTKKDDRSLIDNIVLNNWQTYYDFTARALKTLEKSKYKQYVKEAKKSYSLCHCDFTYHNILFTDDNEPQLIDFDFLTCDTRSLDIGKFLRKELAHFNYKFEICELILRAYNEIYPIDKNEYSLILARLLYPNKFLVIVLDHYLKNKKRPSKVILHRLRKITEERKNFDLFLKKYNAKYL